MNDINPAFVINPNITDEKGATMDLGARGVFNEMFADMLFDVEHIPVPVAGAEDAALSALEEILKRDAGRIAGFIFEPWVQGSAGMRMYSAEALRAMWDLCKAHDVLLIADEVMTGFGRTGVNFAHQHYNIKPDLMGCGKAAGGRSAEMAGTKRDRTGSRILS